MFQPIKVIDVELSQPLPTIEGLDGYVAVQALVRLHGTPLGYAKALVINSRCIGSTFSQPILDNLSWSILRHLLQDALAAPSRPDGLRITDLFDIPHPECKAALPSVTVAVCTRDRTDDLALCLNALSRVDYSRLEILVIDNAPTSDATEHLVRTTYPQVRYIYEPRPGLDWARNRAILEASGEIIAYTDDDVVVDSGWVRALATVFAENPEVMAVTGLVVPYELETEAQALFEQYGGFGRGFERRWYRVDQSRENRLAHGAGRFGTGANMAYRRIVFEQIGLFDPALDVGTVTNGGGDLEMFFRILKEGYTLVYEPSAIVRHRHRRDYARLRAQLTNNGIGLYSYFVCSALAYPDERSAFIKMGLWWLWYWNIRRLTASWIRPIRFPRDLILAELRGSFIGLFRYQKARSIAVQIASSRPNQVASVVRGKDYVVVATNPKKSPVPIALRTVDLQQPLPELTDLTGYASVRALVTWGEYSLGSIDILCSEQSISAGRLRELIVDYIGFDLIERHHSLSQTSRWATVMAALTKRYTPLHLEDKPARLPADVSVSIIVGTHDRPDDLRACLRSLTTQVSPRRVEIIIVDNNPTSGLTPSVVTEFPGVVLVNEPRKGVAYARNAGITASSGEIVVTTDDDVTMPPDWLEKLLAPFARSYVIVVTGNVLPAELESESQRLFEAYGGLGRGFRPFEVGTDWFEQFRFRTPPTWTLGGTANAAFRASVFSNPEIGLMDEALGPGMPSGVGEDIYLFYKILKAGGLIAYEPAAYVRHRHRRDMAALQRQLYNYSKGFVSYHLTTLFHDHDLRALVQLAVQLPWAHIWRLKERWRGRSDYPASFVLLEIVGNLVGPWSLLRSWWRVKRQGRSESYAPVSQQARTVKERAAFNAHPFSVVDSS